MKKTKVETQTTKTEKAKIVDTKCTDVACPFHGKLKTRGKIFEGRVVSKFPRRIAIEMERTIYVRKYERYKKSKTKIHARLPDCLEKEISVGNLIRVQECRPLSKLVHFAVIKKINGKEEEK